MQLCSERWGLTLAEDVFSMTERRKEFQVEDTEGTWLYEKGLLEKESEKGHRFTFANLLCVWLDEGSCILRPADVQSGAASRAVQLLENSTTRS